MTEKGESIRKLYEDALYWHLISKGYSDKHARAVAERRTETLVMKYRGSR